MNNQSFMRVRGGGESAEAWNEQLEAGRTRILGLHTAGGKQAGLELRNTDSLTTINGTPF